MNGVHDMGGLQCFGLVNPDPHEQLFHDEWEKQVLALALAMGAAGKWNLDESRFTRESLPPAVYLGSSYYKIWLLGLERLLVKHGLVTVEELAAGKSEAPAIPVKKCLQAVDVPATLSAGSPVSRSPQVKARFNVGDTVMVVNRHVSTHTRLPAYIRGHRGVISKVHGCHIYPDSHAVGKGEDPQWLYNVSFSAEELWGDQPTQLGTVQVDCWEPYLE